MRATLQFGLLWVTLILCGCPAETETPIQAPVVQQTASPEAEKMFNEAVGLFEAGQLDDATAQFATFQNTFADDPLSGQVLLYRGRIAMLQADYNGARAFFVEAVDAGKENPSYDYARMYQGLCEFHLENYSGAVELLASYAGRFANPEENREVLRTLVKSTAAIQDWQAQIRWSEQLLGSKIPDEEHNAVLMDIGNLLASKTEKQLHAATSVLSEKGAVWTLLMAQIARIQFESEQYDKATDTVAEVKESGSDNAASISELIALIEKRNSVDIRTIGCMLPLSGKMRLIGQDTLKGVMLAAKANRFGREDAPLSVVMRDTASAGKKPEEIVEELVLNDRVAAIVGPMDAKWSKRAAQKAQRLGVPMILLSADETASRVGNYVFRKFASHRAELAALIQYAERTLPSDAEFAVLYPQNGYGRLMEQMFRTGLEQQGKQVVSVSFEPSTSDFGRVVQELRSQSFSGLLLPMTAEQLALAAPALAAAEIWPTAPTNDEHAREVRYLIPSVAYSPSVVSRSGRYLQGAIFVSDFKTDPSVSVAGFSRNFENEYKAAPSTFAAYGYDVTLLISNAVQSGVQTRRDLRTWLDESVASKGLVFPFAGFDEQGESTATPGVMALEGKELVPR